MRLSGIILRHFFIVAPLLSLNGTMGMSSFCHLSVWAVIALLTSATLGKFHKFSIISA